MQILIVQSPHYDFNAATLIQGLINTNILDEENKLILGSVESSNYASDIKLEPEDVGHFANDSDIIFLCSNQGVQEHYLNNINNWKERVVYIDGEDVYDFNRDPDDFLLYFKREKRLSVHHKENVRPMPFAIEDRYYRCFPLWEDGSFYKRKWNLSCMFGPHDNTKPWRSEIERSLIDKNYVQSFIGSLYGGGGYVTVDTGNRDHLDYYTVMSQSKLAVDAHGAHECNSARYWEILANGSCLITRKNLIDMPYALIDGKHCLEYTTVDDLLSIIDNMYHTDFALARDISYESYHYCLENHRTHSRAKYILEQIREKI